MNSFLDRNAKNIVMGASLGAGLGAALGAIIDYKEHGDVQLGAAIGASVGALIGGTVPPLLAWRYNNRRRRQGQLPQLVHSAASNKPPMPLIKAPGRVVSLCHH